MRWPLRANVPLATLSAASRSRFRAYNSCGLGLMAPDKVADEAEKLLAGGFRASSCGSVIRHLQEDLAALRAVRKRVGDEVAVMVDYNQALGLPEALERGRALDQEGIYWLEEPIRHDDYAGNATLVRELADADPDRREFLASPRPWRRRSRPKPPTM